MGLYGYVNNKPIGWVDTYGTSSKSYHVGGIGDVIQKSLEEVSKKQYGEYIVYQQINKALIHGINQLGSVYVDAEAEEVPCQWNEKKLLKAPGVATGGDMEADIINDCTCCKMKNEKPSAHIEGLSGIGVKGGLFGVVGEITIDVSVAVTAYKYFQHCFPDKLNESKKECRPDRMRVDLLFTIKLGGGFKAKPAGAVELVDYATVLTFNVPYHKTLKCEKGIDPPGEADDGE